MSKCNTSSFKNPIFKCPSLGKEGQVNVGGEL